MAFGPSRQISSHDVPAVRHLMAATRGAPLAGAPGRATLSVPSPHDTYPGGTPTIVTVMHRSDEHRDVRTRHELANAVSRGAQLELDQPQTPATSASDDALFLE